MAQPLRLSFSVTFHVIANTPNEIRESANSNTQSGTSPAIGALVYLACIAATNWPSRKQAGPCQGIRFTALAGVALYPAVILIEGFSGRLGNPLLTLLLVLGWEYVSLRWVVRNLNFPGNERHLAAFALGLLIPLFVSGLIVNFPVELVVVEDVALLLFLRYLSRLYPSGTNRAGAPSPAPSASAA